uniref:Uncharacterized protein n=1 Tax=Knipowitschia caucasica TaxID=637954 RepID=A0AAV2JEL3_KNICA
MKRIDKCQGKSPRKSRRCAGDETNTLVDVDSAVHRHEDIFMLPTPCFQFAAACDLSRWLKGADLSMVGTDC